MEGYQQAQPIAPPEATMGLVSPGPPPPPPSVEVTAVTEGGGISGDAMQPQKKVRRSRGEKVPRWTTDEEDRLRALVAQYGDRAWAKVAESLATGRTAAGVDQHWQIMNGKRKRTGPPKDEDLDLPPDGEPDTEEKKAARMEAAAKIKLAREEEKRFKMEVASRKKEIRKAREGLPKKPVRTHPALRLHTPASPCLRPHALLTPRRSLSRARSKPRTSTFATTCETRSRRRTRASSRTGS